MKTGISALLLGLSIISTSPTFAEGIYLKVESRLLFGDAGRTVGLGEPIYLEITAQHPTGHVALLPESLDLGSALGERSAARTHKRHGDGKSETDIYRLQLLFFETGEQVVPSIELAVGSTTAKTQPLGVFVKSGFSKDEQPVATSTEAQAIAALEQMAAPDAPPEQIKEDDHRYLYGLGAFAALLTVLLAYARFRKYHQNQPEPVAPLSPPRPAHEVALEQLQALKQRGLVEEEYKAYFTDLSTILRRYVGARYSFESLDLTLDELLDVLRSHPGASIDLRALELILAEADQVKFAKYSPAPDAHLRAHAEAEALVLKSKPKTYAPEASSEENP